MATFSYLLLREQSIIELIEAFKLEVAANDGKGVNPENYAVWYSIMENMALLQTLLYAWDIRKLEL